MADRIKGLTIEINGDTTGLTSALKSVNQEIKDCQTNLKEVNRALKLDHGNVDLLKQKQSALNDEIAAAKEKLEKEKQALDQLKQSDGFDANSKQAKDLETQIALDEAALKQLTKQADDFGSVGQQAFKAACEDMQAFGQKMSEVGGQLTAKVTTPIVGIGTAAVKTTADFDQSMAKVQAVSGATGDDLEALRDKAKEMGENTQFSASEAAEAMNYMAMAGWKTGDMLDGIAGIMDLAAASGEDLATTSDIVTDALTAFGLQASDSSHFADIMAAASSNANTNVAMMGESFKYAAPVAGALGISAEDTSIAIGLMANAGIKASQSGTALRTGLSNLVKPSKQAATYMAQYGIAVKESDDGSVNLRETMIDLREKFAGMSETEQAAAASAIFGKNAMAGWLAIINASDEDFDKLTEAIDGCDGVANEMAAIMNSTLTGQIRTLMSKVEALAISFGELLMPTIEKVVGKITDFIEKLNNLDEDQKKTIITIATVVAAVGPVLLTVGNLISAVGKIGSAISPVITIFGSLASVLSGPVVLGIGAAIAAGVLIVKNWDTIKGAAETLKETVSTKFGDIKTKAQEAWGDVKTKVSDAWEGIKSKTSTTVESVKKTASDGWSKMKTTAGESWESIKKKVSDNWEGIKTKTSTTVESVKKTASDGWSKMKTTAGESWEGIKTKVSEGWEGIKSKTSTTAESVKKTMSDTWESIKTKTGTAWETIKTSISDAIEGAKKKVSDMIEKIKGVMDFSWDLPKLKMPHVSITGKFSINPPSVPKFSIEWYKKAMDGGMILNTPTIFGKTGNRLLAGGEAGPEAVVGVKSLMSMIQGAVNNAGNTTNYGGVSVVVYGAPGQDVNELADIIASRINASVQRRGAVYA